MALFKRFLYKADTVSWSVDVFNALAEPRRRSIVELLAKEGQLSAGEIYGRFGVTAQAVSQHLRILLGARLLRMEKRAQRHIYSLNPESMKEIEQWASGMHALWSQSLDRLDEVLQEEKKNAR